MKHKKHLIIKQKWAKKEKETCFIWGVRPKISGVHFFWEGKKREKELDDQKEFAFIDKEEDRGYFVDSSTTLYKGINLDRPTYLRKGIKVKFK